MTSLEPNSGTGASIRISHQSMKSVLLIRNKPELIADWQSAICTFDFNYNENSLTPRGGGGGGTPISLSLEQGIQITVSSLEQGGNRVKFTTTLALKQGRFFQP